MNVNRALILLLAVCLLTSCSGNPSTTFVTGYEARVFRINCGASYGSIIPQIINAKGLLDDKLPDDVSIEWSYIESSTNIREALAAQQIDIAAISMPTVISGIENGLPVVIISNSATQSAYVFSNNPNIESIDDIRPEHKISSSTLGGTYGLALMMVCEERYGDSQKFSQSYITMSNADALISLEASQEIDCAILGFPSLGKARSMDNLTPILDLTPTIIANSLSQICVATQQFAEENPLLVQSFLDASQEAMDFLNTQPEEAAALLSEQYGDISPAEIEEQIKAVPFSLEMSESDYDKVSALMYEVGIIDEPPQKFSELPNYASIPKLP